MLLTMTKYCYFGDQGFLIDAPLESPRLVKDITHVLKHDVTTSPVVKPRPMYELAHTNTGPLALVDFFETKWSNFMICGEDEATRKESFVKWRTDTEILVS